MPVRYPGYRSPKEKARMDEFNPKYKPARVDGCRQCRPDSCECEQHRRNKVAGYVDDYGRMQLPGGVEIPPPHTPHIMDGGASPMVDVAPLMGHATLDRDGNLTHHRNPAYYDMVNERPAAHGGYHGKPRATMPGGSPVFPPQDSAVRKATPVTTGFLDYFPLAVAAVARYSRAGNLKHNGPDAPLHWARGKSPDHADCIGRHLLERGTTEPDSGMSHTVALAWRAMALLQKELEMAEGYDRDAL